MRKSDESLIWGMDGEYMTVFTSRRIFGRQGVKLVLGLLSLKYSTCKGAYNRQLKAWCGSRRDRFYFI